MDFGTIIILVTAVLSLLIGYYQGWRVGLKYGLTKGFEIGLVASKAPTMSPKHER